MKKGIWKSVAGALLILAALTALGGLGAAAFLMRAPPTDPATLCVLNAPVRAHTAIVVDATDRLEPRHRRKLRAVLAQERARLTQYDRLTVLKLNPRRPQEPAILFSRCLPRAPEDANPLFENTRLARDAWERDFQGALDSALRSAQSGSGARASPILASVRAVAADADFGGEVGARRLVLISDLLEHQPGGFSLYAADADYSVWKTSFPPGAPNLEGVDVRIVPLDRPEHGARQMNALQRFWPSFFRDAGARSLSVDPAA